jgi:hypothetical protein
MSTVTAPFAALTDALRKGMTDHAARMQAVVDEYAKAEAMGVANARTMAEESAKLTQETITYATKMSTEWRKAWFEGAQRAMALFQTPSN